MQLAQSNHFLRERHSEGLNRWQIFLARSASAQAEQPGLPWRWGESSMMAVCRPSVNLTPLLEVQSPNLNKIKPFEMWQRLDKQQQQKDTVLSPKIQKKPKNILDVILAIKARTTVGWVEVGLSGSVMVLELMSVVLWQKIPRSNRWFKTYSFVVQINTCTCEILQHWH